MRICVCGITGLVAGGLWALAVLSAPAAEVAAPAPRAAAAPQPQAIKGKVVDAEGRPVAEAEVMALVFTDPMFDPGMNYKLMDRTKSAADGTFSVRLSPEGVIRTYVLAARAPKLAVGCITVSPDDAQSLTVVLNRPTSLTGSVVDEQGKPIAGAEVRAIVSGGAGTPFGVLYGLPPVDWMMATTDAEGRFEIKDLPPKTTATFRVTAAGYPAVTNTMVRQGFRTGGSPCRLVLPPAATLRGKVVEAETGRPAAGVTLIVRSGPTSDWMGVETPVITGADGTFEVRDLMAGHALVWLRSAPGVLPDWMLPGRPSVQTGEAEATIKVTRGCVVEVLATDADTGRPLSRSKVFLGGAINVPASAVGDTGDDGVARLRAPAGTYNAVNVFHNNYSGGLLKDEIVATPDKVLRVEVKLKPFSLILGTVTDPDGKPVEGAVVSSGQGAGRAQSDAAGHFEFRCVLAPADNKMVVVVRHLGRGLAAVVHPTQAGAMAVRLEPAADVSGRVVDAQGKPLAGVSVRSSVDGEPWYQNSTAPAIQTDADGRYTIRGVPNQAEGTVRGDVFKDGYGPLTSNLNQVGLLQVPVPKDSTRVEAKDIVLEARDKKVSGRCVDEAGKPVTGVRVRVSVNVSMGSTFTSIGLAETESQADGTFVLEGVGASPFQVSAWQPKSGQFAQVDAKGGDHDLTLTLRPPGSPR